MRCLYCGNELALLKKLTGGGEFCSEAHRQKYQEEYNRLALSRLLQAQPAVAERPLVEATSKPSEPAHAPNGHNGHPVPRSPEVRQPIVHSPPESPPPPEPGFVMDKFEPVLSPGELFSSEPFLSAVSAYLPNRDSSRMPEARLPEPGAVALTTVQGWKRNGRNAGDGPEAREFARPVPKLEINTNAKGPLPPGPLTDEFEIHLQDSPVPPGAPWFAGIYTLRILPSHQLNVATMLKAVASDANVVVEDSLPHFDSEPSGEPLVWDPEFGEPALEDHSSVDAEPDLQPEPAEAILEVAPPQSVTPVDKTPEIPEPALTVSEPDLELQPDPPAAEMQHVSPDEPVEIRLPTEVAAAEPPKPAAINTAAEIHHEVVIDMSIFEEVEDQSGKKPRPAPTADAGSSTGKASDIPIQAGVELPTEAARERSSDLETSPAIDPEPVPELQVSAQPAEDSSSDATDIQPGVEPAEAPVAAEAPIEASTFAVETPSAEPQPTPQSAEPETIPEATQPEPLAAVDDSGLAHAAPETERVPRSATVLMSVDLAPVVPNKAVAPEICPAVTVADFRVAFPELENVPVRSKMVFGPRPEIRPQASSSEETSASLAPALESTPVPAPEPVETPAKSTLSRRESRRKSERPTVRPPASVPAPPPAAVAVEAQPEPVIAATVNSAKAVPQASPVPAPAKAEPPVPAPPEPMLTRRSNHELDDLRLNLEHTELGSPLPGGWSRMTMSKRIAVGSGLLIAVVVAGFLAKSTFASKQQPASAQTLEVQAVGPSLASGAGGWAADWGGGGTRAQQISLLRPSSNLSDYRIEFQGQIEGKTIGWVFRAASPKNYYVNRLEVKKAGLEPEVALTRYAVINGEETQRSETPLPFKTHLDTVYKVRTDVYGSDFKTYVNDQLVSSWSDDRLKSGGFGLMTDRGEQNRMRLVQLYELRAAR